MNIAAAALFSLALPTSGIATVQDKDPNKIICRSDQITGSRMSRRRICHTRAEWKEIERDRDRRADSDGSPFRDEGVGSMAPQAPR